MDFSMMSQFAWNVSYGLILVFHNNFRLVYTLANTVYVHPNNYLINYFFLDNNRNWRDPKEPEPGETKPKSWNRSNSTSDHMSNSTLPEWCNDDEDSIPGSFDASGQFRSFNKVNRNFIIHS